MGFLLLMYISKSETRVFLVRVRLSWLVAGRFGAAGGGVWCGCGVAVAGAGVYDRIPKVSAVCFVAMAVVLLCVPLWCLTCLFACCIAWLLVYAEIPNDDSP